MEKKVAQFIEKWQMFSSDDKVIVGVSGGADSVCLLVLLDELRKNKGFGLHVVHVNHGIRGEEAERDEAYVQNLCKERGIFCEIVREDVTAIAKAQKISEEEAGRNVRRTAFERILEEQNGTKIALAHHQEDNAETFLLHLARGSKLKGLGGIYPVNGVYIRPLLCVGRKEIEAYLEKKEIAYCMDATNLEDTYMRNRVRNHVIPYMKEHVNDKTVEHINSAMEQLREIQNYMTEQVEEAYTNIVTREENRITLAVNTCLAYPSLIQKMVFHKAMAEMSGREKDLADRHVRALHDLMTKQSGMKVDLPYGLEAWRIYGKVMIRKRSEWYTNDPLVLSINLEETREWKYKNQNFSCRIIENSGELEQVPKKTYTKWFDYDIIKGTVDVRTRSQGDRIVIDAEGRSKKLKSFFIDEKIPREERDQIPVLAIGNDVLWIVGYRQSKAYQVTGQTKKVLEVVVSGGN